MIKGVIVKEILKYSDDRGFLSELFRADEFSSYKPEMAYMSYTNPGVVRGPHEHVAQSDLFVFLGPGKFMVHLWDRRQDSDTYEEKMEIEAGEDKPLAILVPPGVVHGYKCTSPSPAMSLNFPDKLYRGENKAEEVDEIRWENKEDSPYVIV